LEARRREEDPSWWNDLAGAHLRLGEAKVAAELLETVTNRFKDDYGIHANLGTAYHLLGRYQEAAREIARDLEINPDAHFGLERYHLALLQYLVRDADFQRTHVYVDEWSGPFLRGKGRFMFIEDSGKLDSSNANELNSARLRELERGLSTDTNVNAWVEREIEQIKASGYRPPPYRFKWDLARDPKFEEGVIYMATLNPKEPACFVMLGVASLRKHDLNLAARAFERAIKLGSPQAEFLRAQAAGLRHYISESQQERWALYGAMSLIFGLILTSVVLVLIKFNKFRNWRKKRKLTLTAQ
jgi:tetratricopeptide (TPR) repeat protein